MLLEIDGEFRDLITPLSADEFGQLEKMLVEQGCLDTIKIWSGVIVDGHNRYAICTKHGLPFDVTEMDFETRTDALNWIIDNQLGRRNLTPWQMSILRGKRYNAEKQEHGGARISSGQNDHLKTREKLAEQFGVSDRTIERDGLFSYAAEKAAQETSTPLMQLTKAQILEAAKEIQAEKRDIRRAERVEIITHAPPDLGEIGKHNVLYADPPWRYEHSISTTRDIENQYPTMELDDICNMPISSIAADDCVLFLWATSPKLTEAVKVMSAWGFSYRTCMVWVKDKIGMGYYARQQHEILLIGARGNLPTPKPENRPPSVIHAERNGHSEKPEEFYKTIENMYPEFSKVELFSRQPRQGWSVWGNQI